MMGGGQRMRMASSRCSPALAVPCSSPHLTRSSALPLSLSPFLLSLEPPLAAMSGKQQTGQPSGESQQQPASAPPSSDEAQPERPKVWQRVARAWWAFQLRQRARDCTRAFTLLTCFCAVCAGEAAPAPATTAAAAVQVLCSDAPVDAQLPPAAAATQGEDDDSAEKTASTTDQPEAKDTGTLLSARKRFRGRRRLAVNSQSAL
jgi:hypothetical protein